MMQKKHNSRGRPILDEKQKVDRDILKQKFMENSIEEWDIEEWGNEVYTG